MDQNKLQKLRKELADLRRSPQRARALESLAKRLGRKLVKRGKHPMWESTEFDWLFPLSIPHHRKDLPQKTRKSILDQLDTDIDAWDERLLEEDDG